MKLNLSYTAITLLKTILSFSGEKELDQRGQDAMSPRRLNEEEASQRRHYFKKVTEFIEGQDKSRNEIIEKAKEDYKKDNEKKAKETEEQYNQKMITKLNQDEKLVQSLKETNQKKFEFEVTDKTFDVIKKYFKEWGNKIGWGVGDDEVLEELEDIMK